MIYAGLATLGLLVSSIPVAYALSRLRWRGRDAVFLVVLIALMLPPQVTVVPLYVMWSKLAPRRHALAADHPELVRRRVLDLPAAPVLPDDPRGVPRRGARGRLRRAPDPHDRRRAAGEAGDRRGRALLDSSTRSTTSSCRCSTSARTRDNWVALDRALAVPLAAPGAVEPDDGGDAARDGAGDRPLLPRAEGVRRGRHADGGEGMKIAVIGGGSTYTPELVSGLSRERERLDVARARPARHRRGAARGRRRPRGADARRGRASTATLERHRRPRPGRSTAPTSCSSRSASAARRRGSPTRRCRSRAAASARRRPAPAGSRRRCAPCRSCSRSPSACASSRRRGAWIVDFTNPVGIVTRALLDAGHRAVGLCNVAIGFQRSFARQLGVEPARRRRRPGRAQPPHLGPRGARRRRGRAARAARGARRRDRRAGRAAARLLEELGVVPSYYLRYFYAHDGCSPSSSTASRARRRSRRSSASCSRSTATRRSPRSRRCSSSAAAPSTARRRPGSSPRSLTGDGAVHEVDVRNDGTLAGLADDDVVEVPARVEPRTARRPSRRRRSRPSCSGSSSTSRRTSGSPRRRRSSGDPASRARRCSPTR